MFQYTWFYKKTFTHVEERIIKEEFINWPDIAQIVPLYWSEHCVECAEPLCYNNCLNWDQREDKKCRRFTYGIKKGDSSSSFNATLKFKKWAKLESICFGGGFVLSKRIRKLDNCNYKTGKIFKFISKTIFFFNKKLKLSRFIEHRRNIRYEKIGEHKEGGLFLFSCYLHNDIDKNFFVEVYTQKGVIIRKTMCLSHGYNQLTFDAKYSDFINKKCRIRMYLSDQSEAELTVFFADFVILNENGEKKLLPTSLESAKKVKCVVWDLDNTIWDGILLEHGPTQLKLKQDAISLIKWLDERGIINCIASKNNDNDVEPILSQFQIDHLFVLKEINWKSKAFNISNMAKTLNLNVNSFAFIDDSERERNEVKTLIPSIRVFSEKSFTEIMTLPEFQVEKTKESQNRRLMYQKEIERKNIQKNNYYNQDEFLLDCKLVGRVSSLDSEEKIERGFELVNRTNQLNLSGNKYSINDFLNIINDSDSSFSLIMELSDKYGDYGQSLFIHYTVGKEIVIDEFAISCRIAGKYVESALINYLLYKHNRNSARLIGKNNKKNKLLIETLIEDGLIKETTSSEDDLILHLKTKDNLNHADIVKIFAK